MKTTFGISVLISISVLMACGEEYSSESKDNTQTNNNPNNNPNNNIEPYSSPELITQTLLIQGNTYEVQTHEFSVNEYKECVTYGPCSRPINTTDFDRQSTSTWNLQNDEFYKNKILPITGISYTQARRACQWHNMDLPGKEEWELIAHHNSDGCFPWGDETDVCPEEVACNSPRISEVCSHEKDIINNICDMGGNIREWVLIEEGKYYAKGGSHRDKPLENKDLMSIDNALEIEPPVHGYNNVGFRCISKP